MVKHNPKLLSMEELRRVMHEDPPGDYGMPVKNFQMAIRMATHFPDLLDEISALHAEKERYANALRKIAGELGEFADADGWAMVAKIRFFRAEMDRVKELEEAAKLSAPKEVEIYHEGQNANTASSVPLTRDFRKTVVERATKDPAFTDSLLDELQDRDTRLAALEKVLEAARRMPYAARTPLLNAAISAVGREERG